MNRYSLRTLALVVGFLLVCLSHAYTSYNLRTTQGKLREALANVGELQVEDHRLLHVLSLPTFGDLTYRWHVFIPPGSQLQLKSEVGVKDGSCDPTANATKLKTGRFALSVAVNRDRIGEWRLVTAIDGKSWMMPIPDENAEWLENSRSGGTFKAGVRHSQSASLGQSFELLSHTALVQEVGSSDQTDQIGFIRVSIEDSEAN